MNGVIRTTTAKTLFPLLSIFHEVNGYALKSVSVETSEDLLTGIAFNFGSKSLIVNVNSDDDTVEFACIDSLQLAYPPENDKSKASPWKEILGQEFGWGWVVINQQGYLDGIILSFGGITPQFLITAVASALKINDIGGQTHASVSV